MVELSWAIVNSNTNQSIEDTKKKYEANIDEQIKQAVYNGKGKCYISKNNYGAYDHGRKEEIIKPVLDKYIASGYNVKYDEKARIYWIIWREE